MLILDHQRLVERNLEEVNKLRRYLLGLQDGGLTEMAIAHERDDSCCKREPWNRTFAEIVLAVNPPTTIVSVNLDHRREP